MKMGGHFTICTQSLKNDLISYHKRGFVDFNSQTTVHTFTTFFQLKELKSCQILSVQNSLLEQTFKDEQKGLKN